MTNAKKVQDIYNATMEKIAVETTKQPQRILAGKRVSIPESILKKWNLREGDYVLVKETSSGLVIVPAEFKEKQIPA